MSRPRVILPGEFQEISAQLIVYAAPPPVDLRGAHRHWIGEYHHRRGPPSTATRANGPRRGMRDGIKYGQALSRQPGVEVSAAFLANAAIVNSR
jgi:hypothetical protein